MKDVVTTLKSGEDSVSVAIEEVGDWGEKVYKRDITNNWDKLYKKPGYDPSTI